MSVRRTGFQLVIIILHVFVKFGCNVLQQHDEDVC